jgi:cytochrome b subunit of formate dehydrogenase
MVEVDVPQSLFEEQGRQLYGAKLLEIQVSTWKYVLFQGTQFSVIGFQKFHLYACFGFNRLSFP